MSTRDRAVDTVVPASTAVSGSRGQRPVGHLRPAVLRHHHQLRRPADHRDPQARTASRHALDRDRLRQHRLRVPVGVRDQPVARRAPDRPRRDAARLLVLGDLLEPCRDGARRRVERLHVRRGSLRARPRRGRQLPGLAQDGGRVVPEEGARAHDGHLQRRLERRCGAHARGGADRRAVVGMAGRVRPHGRTRVRVARVLARLLQEARSAPAPVEGRTRVHPQRSRSTRLHRRSRGVRSCRTGRRGPSSSASSSPTRSGGSTCSGSPTSCSARTVSTSSAAVCRSR